MVSHCPWREVSDTLILLWFDVDKSHPPSPTTHLGPPHRLSPVSSWLNLPDILLPSGIHQDSLRSSDRGGLWLISQSIAICCLMFSCEKPQLLIFFPPKSVWMWHFHLLLPSSPCPWLGLSPSLEPPSHNKWKKEREGDWEVQGEAPFLLHLQLKKNQNKSEE